MLLRRTAFIATAVFIAIACVGFASPSWATTYDLTSDFSSSSNPNGAWSLIYAGSLLPHEASAQDNNNSLFPAIPVEGYFSVGNNLFAPPFVFKAAVKGSLAGESDNSFMSGDIIVHSPNNGSAVSVVWTAPSAGTISDLAVAVWYAHSSVSRSNDVTLVLVASQLASWTVSNSSFSGRSSPGTYEPVGTFNVAAGDQLVLNFAKTGGTFGSLDGVQESFTFTSTVPLPAGLPLFATGVAGLHWFARRRKRKA
jgi:hypothetical protein